MKKGFKLNEFEVSLQGEGRVRVFTNDVKKQKQARDIQAYFEGKKCNKIALLFDNEEAVNKYYTAMFDMFDSRFRNMNTKNLPPSYVLTSVKKSGCATLFTTNGQAQIDTSGMSYAMRNGFTIIKVKDVIS